MSDNKSYKPNAIYDENIDNYLCPYCKCPLYIKEKDSNFNHFILECPLGCKGEYNSIAGEVVKRK